MQSSPSDFTKWQGSRAAQTVDMQGTELAAGRLTLSPMQARAVTALSVDNVPLSELESRLSSKQQGRIRSTVVAGYMISSISHGEVASISSLLGAMATVSAFIGASALATLSCVTMTDLESALAYMKASCELYCNGSVLPWDIYLCLFSASSAVSCFYTLAMSTLLYISLASLNIPDEHELSDKILHDWLYRFKCLYLANYFFLWCGIELLIMALFCLGMVKYPVLARGGSIMSLYAFIGIQYMVVVAILPVYCYFSHNKQLQTVSDLYENWNKSQKPCR